MPILNAHNQTATNRDHLSVEQTEKWSWCLICARLVIFSDLPKDLDIAVPYQQPDEARMLEMVGELIDVRHTLAQNKDFSFLEFGYRRLGYFDLTRMRRVLYAIQ